MKVLLVLIFIFRVSFALQVIEGHTFHSRIEYYRIGKPCACPDDRGKKRCGNNAALCKRGGYNILDCGATVVKSITEYKAVQKQLCSNYF